MPAGNDNFADAAALTIGTSAVPISSIGLTTEPGEFPDGDGKTAWWTFTPPADGWYVVDSLGTGDDENIAGSVYEITPGDPIDLTSISYVGGFYFQTPAWGAVELVGGQTYWFTMDVGGGIDVEYVPRVRAASFSDWITPTEDTFTDLTFSYGHDGTTLNAGDTGQTAYVLNTGPGAALWTLRGGTEAAAWDAVRGIPNALSTFISKGAASLPGWYVGYYRTDDGFDDKAIATQYHSLSASALDTPYAYPGWDASEVAGVQYDGVAHWSDLIVTVQPGASLGFGLTGTPNDDDTIRVDTAAHPYTDDHYVAENFTGTGEKLDVTLLDNFDGQIVTPKFVIYPNRITEDTPLAITGLGTGPPRSAWREIDTIKVSFRATRRPFRFIYPAGDVAPPCQLYPRDDDQGVGTAAIWPPPSSNRPGSYY